MLLRWFNYLWELEVIETEVYNKWREDVNDAYPAKGKALFQVSEIPFTKNVGTILLVRGVC